MQTLSRGRFKGKKLRPFNDTCINKKAHIRLTCDAGCEREKMLDNNCMQLMACMRMYKEGVCDLRAQDEKEKPQIPHRN